MDEAPPVLLENVTMRMKKNEKEKQKKKKELQMEEKDKETPGRDILVIERYAEAADSLLWLITTKKTQCQ